MYQGIRVRVLNFKRYQVKSVDQVKETDITLCRKKSGEIVAIKFCGIKFIFVYSQEMQDSDLQTILDTLTMHRGFGHLLTFYPIEERRHVIFYEELSKDIIVLRNAQVIFFHHTLQIGFP